MFSTRLIVLTTLMLSSLYAYATTTEFNATDSTLADYPALNAPSETLILPTTTQGPLWPPAALSDSQGDFVLAGAALIRNHDGQVELRPNQAMIVSKNTVPPLDENGVETFLDPYGAPYQVVRMLDLSKHSEDLNIVLHANSYGPPEGDFGGGPRVPAEGVSRYNLNSFPLSGHPCPDIFPSDSQRFRYFRPGFPLHQVPISGFQGDNYAINSNTGELFTPNKKTGRDCPAQGCEGENRIDSRRKAPITLGEWLKARVKLKVTLTDYNEKLEAYTAANFIFRAKNLLPNSIYHVFALRSNLFSPNPIPAVADPLAIPAVILTDHKGRGKLQVKVDNPFPAPDMDDAGLRILGVSVAFRSSFQNNGACVTAFGPGVDVHAVANSFADGEADFLHLITKNKRHAIFPRD